MIFLCILHHKKWYQTFSHNQNSRIYGTKFPNFSEINKSPGPNKVQGGWKNISKLISRGGRLLGTREYITMFLMPYTPPQTHLNTIISLNFIISFRQIQLSTCFCLSFLICVLYEVSTIIFSIYVDPP